MASEQEMELRVGRLEDDVLSVHEPMTGVHTTLVEHTQRLDGIDGRLDGIERRLDIVDATPAELLRRLPDPT